MKRLFLLALIALSLSAHSASPQGVFLRQSIDTTAPQKKDTTYITIRPGTDTVAAKIYVEMDNNTLSWFDGVIVVHYQYREDTKKATEITKKDYYIFRTLPNGKDKQGKETYKQMTFSVPDDKVYDARQKVLPPPTQKPPVKK